MHQITPTEGQRIDDRGLYPGLHRAGPVWPLLPDEMPQAAHAATEVDESTQPERVVRWNESPDYPRGTSPGWTALGLLVLAASAVLSIAALVHLAGWLGWLS